MGKEKREKREEVRQGKREERRGPPSDFRALERELAEFHRLLEERTFESEEEIKEFLDRTLAETGGKIPRTAPRTPLEEAQNLVYEAWETKGPERVALARKALEICPDCADAYVILAEESACSTAEARDLYAKGVAAAERALGPEIFKEEAGHFWGLLSTRPYMRARLGLAQCLWELGEYEAAVEHFRDLLRLNPRDATTKGFASSSSMPCSSWAGTGRPKGYWSATGMTPRPGGPTAGPCWPSAERAIPPEPGSFCAERSRPTPTCRSTSLGGSRFRRTRTTASESGTRARPSTT